MRATSRLLPWSLAILLAVGASPQDRRAPLGRVAETRAPGGPPAPPPGTAALPAFALFGWVSPPLAYTTAPRYAELAGAGFNTTVLAWEDSGRVADNLTRLALTRSLGVRNLIFDRRLALVRPDTLATFVWFDSVVADYAGDPAVLGYYLGDEPPPSQLHLLATLFRELRARDPSHPAWNNLLGRMSFPTRDAWLAYTREYADSTQPAVLCNDQYDFLTASDRGQLVENVAGLAAVARERGIPFWGIVLLIEHEGYRTVTPGLLRWQIAQWIAYGARGIGTFTYWTPAPDPVWNWQPAMIDWDGTRTPRYDEVSLLNARLGSIGEALARCAWVTAEYAGSLPAGGTAFTPDAVLAAVDGRAAIGTFADSTGAPWLFVANSDSLAPRTIALTLAGDRRAWRFAGPGAWDELDRTPAPGGARVTLALDAGEFALLRLSGGLDSVAAGRGPNLGVRPNPARGDVHFETGAIAGAARLDVLDLAGRRVWSRAITGGGGVVAWDGARDDGGRAAPGLYLARLEDARGVAVRRFTWLGAR